MNRLSTIYNTKKRMALALGAFLVLLGASTGIYYYSHRESGPIYEFNYARDAHDIIVLFETNRYWLSATQDYPMDFALKHKAPNRNPLYFGKMAIKVLRDNNEFVGFITYYFERPEEAKILFVGVKEKFRGKRYGHVLLQYALNDLKKQGAKRVSLITRTNNFSAQALYKRIGFVEYYRDDEGYVGFEYLFNS